MCLCSFLLSASVSTLPFFPLVLCQDLFLVCFVGCGTYRDETRKRAARARACGLCCWFRVISFLQRSERYSESDGKLFNFAKTFPNWCNQGLWQEGSGFYVTADWFSIPVKHNLSVRARQAVHDWLKRKFHSKYQPFWAIVAQNSNGSQSCLAFEKIAVNQAFCSDKSAVHLHTFLSLYCWAWQLGRWSHQAGCMPLSDSSSHKDWV